MEQSSSVGKETNHFLDITFISYHSHFKASLRVSIVCVVMILEGSLRSIVDLKRVPSLLMHC